VTQRILVKSTYRTRAAQRCPESDSRFDLLSDNIFLLELTKLYAPNRKTGMARTRKRLEMRTISRPTDTRKAPEANRPILVPLPAWVEGS
jgi:hypothetical protein